jgi:cytochrome c oxidase cbb3-type subunit III
MNRAALWLALFMAAFGCGYVSAQDPDGIRQQQAIAAGNSPGRKEFQKSCGFCHGPDGRGASGPDLIRSSLVSHDVNGNLVGPVVRNGRPEKGMPAFPLSDVQIRQIAEFLHAEAQVASSVARTVPEEYPLEKLLVGSAQAGKAYFNGRCAECHSPTGDLAHIASKYKPIDLQTRIAFPTGIGPTVAVTDSSGKTITGEQTHSDEFIISLRDRNGWVHSWNRSTVKVQVHDPLAAHVALLSTYTDKNLHDVFAYLETLK